MGSNNRDYMRDDRNSDSPSWGHDVPTTKWLIIVTVVVFFLQSILTHNVRFQDVQNSPVAEDLPASSIMTVAMQGLTVQASYVEEWFSLHPDFVRRGQVWRLVTYVFCNPTNNPWFLVMNMAGLWYLGSVLERMYGSRELLWFYLCAALVSGLIFTGFGLKLELPTPLMGSVAPVVALLALYATHFPRQEVLFCWVIPMQVRVLLAIFVAVDVFRIMQVYSGQAPSTVVAYMSELWGIVFGYLYRTQNWRLTPVIGYLNMTGWRRSLRRASVARTLKVFQPESQSGLDDQVDAILAKIHEQGSESLTDRERSILQRASDRAKNKM